MNLEETALHSRLEALENMIGNPDGSSHFTLSERIQKLEERMKYVHAKVPNAERFKESYRKAKPFLESPLPEVLSLSDADATVERWMSEIWTAKDDILSLVENFREISRYCGDIGVSPQEKWSPTWSLDAGPMAKDTEVILTRIIPGQILASQTEFAALALPTTIMEGDRVHRSVWDVLERYQKSVDIVNSLFGQLEVLVEHVEHAKDPKEDSAV